MKSYFNTTGEDNGRAEAYERQASRQERFVLTVFRESGGEWSPSQVYEKLSLPGTPLTSIRRAMTNLTTVGLLVKTAKKQNGLYGRPEHIWVLAGRDKQQTLFGGSP